MKFDINAARSSGYSDEEIADYLAKENNFDLGAALKSGYSAEEVVGFLSSSKAAAPAPPAPAPAPAARAAAENSTNSDPMGSDFGAAIMGAEKPAPRRSVLEDAPLPAPAPLIERRGAPVTQQQFEALRNRYDSATPEQRAKLLQTSGYQGGVYKSISDQYGKQDELNAKAPSAKVLDTRREARRDRLIDQGLDGQAADNVAKYDALAGSAGRQLDSIKPSDFDFETQKEFERPKAQGVLTETEGMLGIRSVQPRGIDDAIGSAKAIGGKVVGTVQEAAAGAWQAIGDLTSAVGGVADSSTLVDTGNRLSSGNKVSQQQAKRKLQAIGDNPNGALDFIESGVSGALTNAVPFLAGPAIGLSAIGAQVFGKEYGEGKTAGLSPVESATRASLMTAAEIIGEAASLPSAVLKPFRMLAKNIPSEEIMPAFAKMLVKENLAEQVTTALQFGTDKFTPIGLRQNATLQDYLQDVGETFKQTMAQTLAMGGAHVVANKAGQALRGMESPERALQREIENSTFDPAYIDAAVRASLDPNAYDATLVNPAFTTRTSADIGPSAPIINFTPADSPTAKAGLAPIVVPNAPETTDVSTLGATGGQLDLRSPAGGDQLGGGLGISGLGTDGAEQLGGGNAGLPAANDGADVLAAGAGRQSIAGITLPRVTARATDQDLLARTEAAIAGPQNNNDVVQPTEQWFGRKGDGYATPADASQAIGGRQRMFPTLDWKVEEMPGGKYRLAGYEQKSSQPAPTVGTTEAGAGVSQPTQAAPIAAPSGKPFSTQQTAAVFAQQNGITGYSTVKMDGGWVIKPTETTLGTQTPQAIQGQAQGQQAPAIGGATSQGVAGGLQLGTAAQESIPAVAGAAAPGVADNARQLASAQPELGQPLAAGASEGERAAVLGGPLFSNKVKSAPISVIKLAQDYTKRWSGAESVPVSSSNLTEQQRAASLMATLNGQTMTFMEHTGGDQRAIPNGLAIGGKHVIIDVNSEDAPLAVAMHEVVHNMPDNIRKPLEGALRNLFKSGMEGDFKTEFNYEDADLDKEIPAMITQAVTKRKDFWNELRQEMGNKDFSAVAELIITRLDNWVRGVRTEYGDGFVSKYVTDVEQARSLVAKAYAQSMREQGLQPNEAVAGEVAASNRSMGAMDLTQDLFTPQTAAERRDGFAIKLNNPVTLKDGSRLSGFTDAVAQTTFYGYDKNGERFTIRRDAVRSEDIVSSKDSNRTADAVRSSLGSGSEIMLSRRAKTEKVGEFDVATAKADFMFSNKLATGNSGQYDTTKPEGTASESSAPSLSASQDDSSSRVGKVDTHVLNVTRGERTVSDRTSLSADEKTGIRAAAKKMNTTISEVEEMVRDAKSAHPISDGWSPLTFTGVKVNDDTGKFDLQYQVIPYQFNVGTDNKSLSPGAPEYVGKVASMGQAMLREVRNVYQRAQGGDKAASNIIAQSGWYKEMRTRLRQEFGGLGDLFADLLGATSPNTPVRTNWDNSVEALRLATTGQFDNLLPRWVAWADGVEQAETQFRAFFDSKQKEGLSKKSIKALPEYQALQDAARAAREFSDDMLPVKANGKKFGFNGQNVARAMVDLWRVVKNADPDIGRGGTAPKAINFSGNLIGFRARATIDVWAARMLQRLAGGLRVPSMAEGGVSGEALEDGRNTLQFGFGQDVFSNAVGLIRNDAELSQDPVLRSINDDDLQALVWFIEKEVWTKGNWTSAAGEGGSFEFESDLAGVSDRERVKELRKIADSSVASSPDQRQRADSDINRLRSEAESIPAIVNAQATLDANADAMTADKVAPKGEKLSKQRKEEIKRENAAARDIISKAKNSKEYKAIQAAINKAKAVLKKPTTDERQKMRADALGELGGMARTVDRFTAGVTVQKGAEQGMEPTPPSDAEMAELADGIVQAIVAGDNGATVVGVKAMSSRGLYGNSTERALDLEAIVTGGFDARPLAAAVFSAAQESDQDAAFVARVLRPDEQFDPLLHRPGVEIYFRDMNQAKEAARIMGAVLGAKTAVPSDSGPAFAENLGRVSKPSEAGPAYFEIGGYTVIVDGRPTAKTKAGAQGVPVGMRVIYMPEFEARYGVDPRLETASKDNIRDIVNERAKDLVNFADKVLRTFDGVSFAGRFNYEVDTRFAGEYQGAIDAYTNTATRERADLGRSKTWQGRSNSDSIAAAIGRVQADGAGQGGSISGGDKIRASNRIAGDGRGRNTGGSYAPLAGAPSHAGATGPIQDLVAVAEQYAGSIGADLKRQATYLEIDPALGARIAEAYAAMEHAPNDLRVQASYDALIRETRAQYDALIAAGYTFTFFDSENDPYKGNPWGAMRDIRDNKTMAVYGTYDGYGNEVTGFQADKNLLVVPTGLTWPDQAGVMHDVTANDLFRAVHDAFGHGLEGAGFRGRGEANAFEAHARLFSPAALMALTNETRAQNSWLNFNPKLLRDVIGDAKAAKLHPDNWKTINVGEHNQNANVEDTIFADQKNGVLPKWTWTEGRVGDMGDTVMSGNRAAPDTPAFRKWFGDSAVVDGSGKPIVMYHGTSRSEGGDAFTKFDSYGSSYGLMGLGSYFTREPMIASEYTRKGRGDAPTVYPVYLSIQNPLDMEAKANAAAWIDAFPDAEAFHEGGDTNESWYRAAEDAMQDAQVPDYEGAESMQAGIRSMGYDGITHIGGGRVNKTDGVRHRVFIAFDPEQIKSATGNSGEFDANNPDIRNSNRRQKLSTIGQNYTLPATGFVDRQRVRLQDDSLRMKRVIEAVEKKTGTKVGEAQNFYDANTLMPGRIQATMDDFRNNVMRPLINKAVDFGIDLDELALYAYAKHAKERNAYIASINKRFPDGGSGMTNDHADTILQLAKVSGDAAKFEELHKDLMAITSTTRQVMLAEGLITQDEFNALDGAYDNYIPLRGLENVDENTGAMRPGIGRGINVRGGETIKALGRKSQAGDLIENVIRDYQRVILRVEKNDVGKVLLDFVLSNPDPDLWGVDVERSKPALNKATGLVQYTKSIEKGEDTIGVKVGGQQVYIKLADPELTRAIRQAWKDETSGLEHATLTMTGWWNNWMRNVLTRYNPAFAAINIPRDALWSGTAAALDELGPKGLGKYLANYGKALMASTRQEAGVSGTANKIIGNPQMDRVFQEFRNAGSMTGGFYMRSLEEINKDLRNDMLLAGAKSKTTFEAIKSLPPYKLATLTLKMLEFMGSASENATRFALYQAAKEVGKTPAQAALLAKNGTTNFNRKGEWGGALNNLYLFFNANVQGNAQLIKVLKNPAVQASMAGVTGIGMMLALYGAASGGDDDDGEAYWDKIPSYVKERNLVIMLPPGDALSGGIQRAGKRGRYVTIPVQYGFNIFPNAGYMMADILRNAKDPKRGVTPTKAALHMASTVFGSANPFGGSVDFSDGVQVLLAAMPTLADLPIQLATERNTFGSASSPFKSPWDVRPDSERMFTSQQDSVSAKIAKALNELGGGNEGKAGSILGMDSSVAPGTIQTLISATTGGLGSFVEQVGSSVIAMTGDSKDLKANKIPFLNKFYGEVDEGANTQTARERMDKIKKLADEVKAQQKLGLDPKLTKEEDRMIQLAKAQETYQETMSQMRKYELDIIKDAKLTDAEKRLKRRTVEIDRDKLATDMNREYLKVVPK